MTRLFNSTADQITATIGASGVTASVIKATANLSSASESSAQRVLCRVRPSLVDHAGCLRYGYGQQRDGCRQVCLLPNPERRQQVGSE